MRNALNIYKRKDGRFEGRIPFGRNDNGSLKYRYFYSKDLAELKDKMLSAYTSIEKYNTISCAKTLSEICAEWLLVLSISLDTFYSNKNYATRKI